MDAYFQLWLLLSWPGKHLRAILLQDNHGLERLPLIFQNDRVFPALKIIQTDNIPFVTSSGE